MNKKLSIIIIALALLIGGYFYLSSRQTNSSNETANTAQTYGSNDAEKPALVIEPTNLSRDIGTIKVTEERTAEFVLKNTGSKPLVISRLRTSCMCTFGEIVAKNRKSPSANMEMHNSASVNLWRLILEPNETATARVVYKPLLMPVQGPIERVFLFDTNDPLHPQVELVIKAFVTP